jgi:hypothetical protein
MDVVSQWEEIKKTAQVLRKDTFLKFCDNLCQAYSSGSSMFSSLNELEEAKKRLFIKEIQNLMGFNLVETGALPQMPAALLASLYFVARGEQVFILTWRPLEISSYQDTLKIYNDALGIKTNTAQLGKQIVYDGDIIIVDYIKFAKDFYNKKLSLGKKDTVAVICEADLCLWDRRLFFFEGEELRAAAAVFETTGGKPVVEKQKRVLDFKEVASSFSHLCGLSSGMLSDIREELKRIYNVNIVNVVKRKENAGFPALVFKNQKEKFEALCTRAVKTENNVLIFCYSDRAFSLLKKEFESKNCKVSLISNKEGLRNFFYQREGNKQIGIFHGLPDSDWAMPLNGRNAEVFLAEHFPLLHHHLKIKIFSKEILNTQSMPVLYFSLDDQVAMIYTTKGDFSRSFNLIEFTEKKYSKSWVRKFVAQRILRNVYRLRQLYWQGGSPILTSVFFPSPHEFKKIKEVKKQISKNLSGFCFCGSGKKFKDCHGKI